MIWVHNEARLVRESDGTPRFWQGLVFDVTERKLAEERLREAEERYRHLVEHLPVAVYTDAVDDESTAVYISPRYEELTGYSPQERLADPGLWTRMLHPDDRDRVIEESLRTNETGDPFDVEYRVVRKDGTVAWLHDHATKVVGPDGVPVWQGVLQDVTEERTALEALARRDAILEATGFAAARLLARSGSRCSTRCSAAWARLPARPAHTYTRTPTSTATSSCSPLPWWGTDLGGRPRLPSPGERPRTLDRRARPGRPVHGPVHHLPADEQSDLRRFRRPGREHPVRPGLGRRAWWGSIGIDVVDVDRRWHDSEIEALARPRAPSAAPITRDRAARRYRALIEQIPAVTYIEDSATATEVYVSPQIEAMLGYTVDEWLATDLWTPAVHPDDLAGVNAEDAPRELDRRYVPRASTGSSPRRRPR